MAKEKKTCGSCTFCSKHPARLIGDMRCECKSWFSKMHNKAVGESDDACAQYSNAQEDYIFVSFVMVVLLIGLSSLLLLV